MSFASFRSQSARLATVCLALIPAIASATVTLENTHIQLGGFFSQGYLQSWGNNYPVEAKGGTFDFREMAANVSTTFGPKLRVGAQAFAQRLGAYGDDRVILDWAVADYNFSQAFGVRVGRIKYPKGLYGEALDLDVVRPFIFLPGSIYGAVVRDFSASFDGAMTYGNLSFGRAGSVDYKVFYGDIKMNTRQGVADFFNNGPTFARGVERVGLDHVAGTDVMWTTPVSGLRVGASYSYLKELFGSGTFAYVPGVIADIRGNRYDTYTVSTEYVVGSWTFAAEFQRTRDVFTVTSIGPKILSPNATRSFYFAASRRLNRWLEVGAYHSQSKNLYRSATNTADQEFIKDNTLSVRFDLNERLLFKLEGHYIDGQMNMFNTPRTPNPIAGRKEHTTLFAAKTTFSF